MANAKTDKLRQQLELYSTQIDKYEKAFLASDGKIDAQEQKILNSIRVLLDKINAKINPKKTSNKSVENSNAKKTFEDEVSDINSRVKAIMDRVKAIKSKLT